MKDELETSLTVRKRCHQRRAYIAANDLFKGKTGYHGAQNFPSTLVLSLGSISVDRKVMCKEHQPDPEVAKDSRSLMQPHEPAKEETPEESAPEVLQSQKRTVKNRRKC